MLVKKSLNKLAIDDLGISSLKSRIHNNLKYLREHPLFNTTVFLHEDQEFVKNHLETVEGLMSDNNLEQNIGNFLSLFNTQIEYVKSDFDQLYKFVKGNGSNKNKTLINPKNFLTEPFHESEVEAFKIEQEEIKLLNRIKHGVVSLVDVAKQFNNLYQAVNKTIPPFLNDAMMQVNQELSSFRRLRSIADNARTESFYDSAVDKYRKLEKFYRTSFYIALSLMALLSISILMIKGWLNTKGFGNVEFWLLKFSVLAVGITLITYFLKQSSHYQHLADQNYQTQIELQAYPSFMESIPSEEAAAVRKELALKYFGREINGVAHKDTSSLISDQMKSTTDMVKATTEAIKNLNKG